MELLPELITTLAQGFFYLLLLVVIVHAVALLYHWYSYGTNHTINVVVSICYGLGVATLLTTLWVSIGYF